MSKTTVANKTTVYAKLMSCRIETIRDSLDILNRDCEATVGTDDEGQAEGRVAFARACAELAYMREDIEQGRLIGSGPCYSRPAATRDQRAVETPATHRVLEAAQRVNKAMQAHEGKDDDDAALYDALDVLAGAVQEAQTRPQNRTAAILTVAADVREVVGRLDIPASGDPTPRELSEALTNLVAAVDGNLDKIQRTR